MASSSQYSLAFSFAGLFKASLPILLAVISLQAHAEKRFTAFNSDPKTLHLTPAGPLPTQYHIRIENRVPVNFFGHISTDISPSGKAKKHRLYDSLQETYRTQVCDAQLMREPNAPKLDDNTEKMTALLNAIIYGQPGRQVSRQALNVMESREYISKEEFTDYYESDEALDKNQSTELSTVSWISVADFLKLFPAGTGVPWHLLAEVLVPDTEENFKLTDVLSNPSSKAKILLRRSTLRLVASLTLDRDGWHNNLLPWEKSGFDINRDQEVPFAFELSRAAQIPGTEREALELTKMALLLAVQKMHLLPVVSPNRYSPYAIPRDKIKIYAHSLKPGNTRLYEKTLGFTQYHVVGKEGDTRYHAVMMTSLAELIAKTEPWTADPLLMKFMRIRDPDRKLNWWDLEYAIELLRSYRGYRRSSIDLIYNRRKPHEQSFTLRIPKTKAIGYVLERESPMYNDKKAELYKAYASAGYLDYSTSSFAFGQDPVFNYKLKFPPGAQGLLSGFMREHYRDSDYVAKIILAFKNTVSQTMLEGLGVVLVFNYPELDQQARNLGLKEVDFGTDKPKGFAFNQEYFAANAAKLQSVSDRIDGRPENLSFQFDGLGNKEWLQFANPGL